MKRVFKNAKIVDVVACEVREGAILVEDGVIAAVGDVVVPEDAEVVDLGGKTVMPGLFNTHVHMCFDAAPAPCYGKSICNTTIDAQAAFRKHLNSGVTFIRDLGGFQHVDIEIRNAARQGRILAPDMQVSGMCISMTGGHGWQMACEVDGPDEARKAARKQLKAGADWLKIMATGGVMTMGSEPGSPQLTEEEMRAAIEEAHKVGVKTSTHAQGMTGIKNVLRAGIDTIEHGFFMDDWCFDWMKEHDVYYVPTLSAVYWICKMGTAAGIAAHMVKKAEDAFDAHRDTFLRAYKAGVKIALGTDAGTPLNKHDMSLYEMVLMRDAGMDVWDALKGGTIIAAQMCGVEKTHGSIEVGKRANLAVFAENPVEKLETVMDCQMTVLGGEIVFQK